MWQAVRWYVWTPTNWLSNELGKLWCRCGKMWPNSFAQHRNVILKRWDRIRNRLFYWKWRRNEHENRLWHKLGILRLNICNDCVWCVASEYLVMAKTKLFGWKSGLIYWIGNKTCMSYEHINYSLSSFVQHYYTHKKKTNLVGKKAKQFEGVTLPINASKAQVYT